MWQVLAHPTDSIIRSRTRSFLVSALCTALVIFQTRPVAAQGFVSNGQFFTAGLAIGDAPQPGSTQHAGSDLVVAIDLSGDGKIPQSAFLPTSTASTHYNSLELYLVSSKTNLNLTVSSGTGLLTQEPGSTVKHLNWPIPTCTPPGDYNLTFYEGSTINNQNFFSITPLSITLQNAGGSSQSCTGSNPLQTQPQPSSPPAQNPVISGVSQSATGIITVTVGPSGLPTGGQTTASTEAMTTATVVIISIETLTTVPPGQSSAFATTLTTESTMTTVMPTVGLSGFLPVNGALTRTVAETSHCFFGLFLSLALLRIPWA